MRSNAFLGVIFGAMSIPELSVVRLRRSIGNVPEGSVGTVVHSFHGVDAVIVEFHTDEDGWECLWEIDEKDLEECPDAKEEANAS